MIKTERLEDGGLDVTLDGQSDDLVAEFSCILQNMIEAEIMDKQIYDICWQMVSNVLNFKKGKEDNND